MSLFKKKQKPKTVQEIQQEIMNTQFDVLKGFLEQNALKYKMKELELDTQRQIQHWEALTKLLTETQGKIKDEIDETINNSAKADNSLI
jgi:hypothetical protein